MHAGKGWQGYTDARFATIKRASKGRGGGVGGERGGEGEGEGEARGGGGQGTPHLGSNEGGGSAPAVNASSPPALAAPPPPSLSLDPAKNHSVKFSVSMQGLSVVDMNMPTRDEVKKGQGQQNNKTKPNKQNNTKQNNTDLVIDCGRLLDDPRARGPDSRLTDVPIPRCGKTSQ